MIRSAFGTYEYGLWLGDRRGYQYLFPLESYTYRPCPFIDISSSASASLMIISRQHHWLFPRDPDHVKSSSKSTVNYGPGIPRTMALFSRAVHADALCGHVGQPSDVASFWYDGKNSWFCLMAGKQASCLWQCMFATS